MKMKEKHQASKSLKEVNFFMFNLLLLKQQEIA